MFSAIDRINIGDMIFQLIFFIVIIVVISLVLSKGQRKKEYKQNKEIKGLKIIRIILSVITLLLAGYGLLSDNFVLQSLMIFFLGLLILVMGIDEFNKGKKGFGYLCIAIAIFISIQSFFLN
ncbi:hypothetical protein ACFOUV_12785 [Oceanobacillus longus]|uniref:DUF3953 domain-containing protein n=1 Tax=Oceanobacillus longus TaxID=930120 RepID=A0ABV8H1D9_9BACI